MYRKLRKIVRVSKALMRGGLAAEVNADTARFFILEWGGRAKYAHKASPHADFSQGWSNDLFRRMFSNNI